MADHFTIRGKDQLQAGEWWLDRVAKEIWYKPRAGEALSAAKAVVPVLETLLVGSGNGTTKLTGISFTGISFQHATWFSEQGFVENQSGDAACAGFFGPLTQASVDQRLPSNVQIFNAKGITFDKYARRQSPPQKLVSRDLSERLLVFSGASLRTWGRTR